MEKPYAIHNSFKASYIDTLISHRVSSRYIAIFSLDSHMKSRSGLKTQRTFTRNSAIRVGHGHLLRRMRPHPPRGRSTTTGSTS